MDRNREWDWQQAEFPLSGRPQHRYASIILVAVWSPAATVPQIHVIEGDTHRARSTAQILCV